MDISCCSSLVCSWSLCLTIRLSGSLNYRKPAVSSEDCRHLFARIDEKYKADRQCGRYIDITGPADDAQGIFYNCIKIQHNLL